MTSVNWKNLIDHPIHRIWSGYAYEQVCFLHIDRIKKGLGISGIESNICSWKSMKSENGAQIDLVIDRRDQTINLCEIKFSISEYVIDKTEDQVLRNKLSTFKEGTSTKKTLFLTMITSFGVKKNENYGLIQNELTLEDLF